MYLLVSHMCHSGCMSSVASQFMSLLGCRNVMVQSMEALRNTVYRFADGVIHVVIGTCRRYTYVAFSVKLTSL